MKNAGKNPRVQPEYDCHTKRAFPPGSGLMQIPSVMPFTIGLDYGTNSARAVVVDCADGREIGTAVVDYPSGHQGILLNPADHHLARQSPADYVFVLEQATLQALAAARSAEPGFSADQVIGIGMDGTGSSPIPVDSGNVPIASKAEFSSNLNAQCWLWKDHTGIPEAAAITETAARMRPQYLAKIGGTYSSEWFWAKIWHCLKVDEAVFDAAYSWVELADFIPAVLAGVTDPRKIQRGVCMAGHKALYAEDWNGLPDKEFLTALNPKLADLRDRLYDQAHDASAIAGHLCVDWAEKLGLPAGIPIAIGEMDVHYGAIGCGVDEGTLVKVIGTSTCDCAVVSAEKTVADIPGICGIVKGAILPGYFGIEAGQSAVGDIFKWFVEGVLGDVSLHGPLTDAAAALRPGQSGLLALDWNNGNRTILVDQSLTGLLLGQTLYTTQGEIYRALIEATAFGARAIVDRIREYGVPVERIVCSGGIAEKNPLLMQIYADVTGCEMRVSRSSQACALGSAIGAAVIAGAHPDFKTAQAAMTGLKEISFKPIPENQAIYQKLYDLYRELHDAFGGVNPSANLGHIMKDLLALKAQQSH
jgi:L-ribulokinase